MICGTPKPVFPNPYFIGIKKAKPYPDGYSVWLQWAQALPSTASNEVGYNVYFSTDKNTVLSEGPKYFTRYSELTIRRFVPGDVVYVLVRASEYTPTIQNPLNFVVSPQAENAFIFPETALTSNIDAITTIIPLVDVSEFPTYGVLKIGYELIRYANVDYPNNIIHATVDGRGYYNTTATVHTIDGYDGYIYLDPTVGYSEGWEDLNLIYTQFQPRFEQPEFPFTESDGYRTRDKDILNTDLSASDDNMVDFPPYDHSGYHRTSPVDYFSGVCIGSYHGGEQGCADNGGKTRNGINLQDRSAQRLEEMLEVTGEDVVLLKRKWTGITCNCVRLNQEIHEGRCHTCFTPDSLVRTSHGYKEISEIKIGEYVLSSDGNYYKVTDTMCNSFDGYLKSIYSTTNTKPILTTPNHPFLTNGGSHAVKRGCGPKCDNYIKMGDGNCRPMDITLLPSNKWYARVQINNVRNGNRIALGTFNTKEEAQNVIKKYRNDNINLGHILEWRSAENLTEKSWLVSKYPNYIKDVNEIKIPQKFLKNTKLGNQRNGIEKFTVDEEFMWIVGIYLAEGCCGNRSIIFALHKKEIEFQNRIIKYFKSLGFGTKLRTTSENGVVVNVYSTTLSLWFKKLFGNYCYNKKIPEEFMYLCEEKSLSLIKGIYDGDGDKSCNEITQTSEILALQISELLQKFGEQPIIRKYQSNVLTPNGNKRRPAYCVNWAENTAIHNNRKGRWMLENELLSKVKKIGNVKYDGYVYNLEVESDHTYVVNGIVVHNCFGTGFVGGYDQYYNPRDASGRIKLRFPPTVDNLPIRQHGLQQEFVPSNAWTLVVPSVKDRDVFIRFNEDNTEEFRYEIVNVTRNKLMFGLSGAQTMTIYRLDKTDPAYQWRSIRDTSLIPGKLNTTMGVLRLHGPHAHVVTVNENITTLAQINSTTSTVMAHNHPIINGVVQSVLSHSHAIILV